MQPKVSFILLNWNGWQDTIECLESLFQIEYSNYDVIVVDNDSEDNSISQIKDYAAGNLRVESRFFEYDYNNKPLELFEYGHDKLKTLKNLGISDNIKNLIIIKNKKNEGFAEGNNIGIEFANDFFKPDFFFLLNNDTVVSPNFLLEIMKIVKHEKKIAIAGPKVYHYDYGGDTDVLATSGGYLNWLKSPGYHRITNLSESLNEPINVDWITGASLLIRSDVPNNRLSNDFFFGAEDVDLCIRTKKEGYRIYLIPNSIIWHKLSVSRKKKYSSYIKSVLHNIKSNFLLLKKHQRFYLILFILYLIQIIYAHIIAFYRKYILTK